MYSLFINPIHQIPKENDSGEKGRLSPVKVCNVTNGSRSRYCHTCLSLSGHVFSKAHETCNLVVCQHEGQGTQNHADERRNVNSSGLVGMLFSWFGTVTLQGNVARVWIMGTVGVPGVVKWFIAVWRGRLLDGYPAACPVQPYLDYKYILPHLPKYVKLNISIFSCFFKVSLRRKMYISRRTQRQIIRIFIIFYYCLSGGALKLKSVNFLTIQLSTDNSRH